MERKAGRRAWVGLAVIALPCMLYAMDLTVLNLAVPKMSAALHPSSSELLWIVDVYGFMVAGFLVTMGALGDRFGRRRVLLVGAACFGAASVLAALARTSGMLIAARAILGVAGATLAPSTLALIRNMFPNEEQRQKAIGIWISSYSVGGALGPLLGGLVLQHFDWHSVFLLGIPVMGLLLAAGPFLLPEYRDPSAGVPDLTSVLLSLSSILSVVWGVKRVAESGGGRWPLVVIALGLVLGVLFVRRQRRLADPLIDLGLFRVPGFPESLGAYLLGTFAAFGIFVYETQYLQLVLGLSPLSAGLWTTPFALGFIGGSLFTPALARRASPRVVMAAGLLFAVPGFALLGALGPSGSPALLSVSMFVYSLGLAPVFTLATDVIVGSAPPERAGGASALSETGSELGGALGIALLGSVGVAVGRALAGAHGSRLGLASDGTLGAALETARTVGGSAGARLSEAAVGTFLGGFHAAAMACVLILLGTATVLLRSARLRPTASP